MTRKARWSFDHSIDSVALLPWLAGWLLVLLAYWIFRDFSPWRVALESLPGNAKGAEMALAEFSRYMIPGLLLFVTLTCIARAGRQGAMSVEAETSPPALDALARMNAYDFSRLVAEAFRREGFLVVERAGVKADGAVDLELFMGRDHYLVQCGRWKEMIVDVPNLREFHAAISAEKAVGGFIVTMGKLTDEARKMALGRSIRVIPADSLRRLIRKVTPASHGEVTISPMFSRWRADPAPPACPRCGKAMMRRPTKLFEGEVPAGWGCTSFPACLGSREM